MPICRPYLFSALKKAMAVRQMPRERATDIIDEHVVSAFCR